MLFRNIYFIGAPIVLVLMVGCSLLDRHRKGILSDVTQDNLELAVASMMTALLWPVMVPSLLLLMVVWPWLRSRGKKQ